MQNSVSSNVMSQSNLNLILGSLDAKPYQTVRHLCENTGLTIDEILIHADFDEQIDFQMCGSLTVYFLKQNRPKGRLYNTGNNYFAVTNEEKTMQKTTKVTPEFLEELAFKGCSKAEAAALCQVKETTFNLYLAQSRYPQNAAAWKRGLDRRQSQTILPVAQSQPEIVVEPRFEHTLEHISKNGRSSEGIEKVKTELVGTAEIEVGMDQHKLRQRIEADLLFSIAYNQASPKAEETLKLLRSI